MQIKECYQALGGDFEAVLERIPTANLVDKLIRRFPEDPSFEDLCQGLQEQDYELAFRAAHSIKGVSLNLGFPQLSQSSARMADYLRDKQNGPIDRQISEELLQQLKKDYLRVLHAIEQLDTPEEK